MKILASKLEVTGIDVTIASGDADTTIVKVALSASGSKEDQIITVASDDTDVFCLLIHHCDDSNSELYDNIYLIKMKKEQ